MMIVTKGLCAEAEMAKMVAANDYVDFVADSRVKNIASYADIVRGDTILSTISFRFPPNIMIGTVTDFKVAENITNYEVKLRLSADFSRLKNVLVVKYHHSDELKNIEKAMENLQNVYQKTYSILKGVNNISMVAKLLEGYEFDKRIVDFSSLVKSVFSI